MKSRIIKLLAIAAIPALSAGCTNEVSFSSDIQPILNDKCMECHDGKGKGSQKSGFNVSTYAQLMAGTSFGPVIVKGDSTSSTLYRMVAHKADPKLHMPPHHKDAEVMAEVEPLSDAQIALIKAWIDQGAKNN